MSNPFDWKTLPSQLAAALKPHPGNKKPGAPITLNGSLHGGAYSRAVPAVSDDQAKAADSMWGNI